MPFARVIHQAIECGALQQESHASGRIMVNAHTGVTANGLDTMQFK